MLTNLMEGNVKLAPESGNGSEGATQEFIPCYGKANGTSAPETSNADNQPQNTSVGGEGQSGATKPTTQTEPTQPQNIPAWMAQLPKELRGNEELAKYKTMGEAFKDLIAKSEEKNATPTNQNEPEAEQNGQSIPVKYNNFAKKLSDNFDPLGDLTNNIVDGLQNLGIPQDKAEAIIDICEESNKNALNNLISKGVGYTEEVMKKQWGNNYEQNRKLMTKGYVAIDPDGSLQKILDASGTSLQPSVWEVLSRVGKLVSEDKAVGSQKGKGYASESDIPVKYIY